MNAPRTARERVRAELTREIKEAARKQLASAGAAGLSLRAVARDLGMVSSALYRYFPSRDELLTALIIDAYDAVGAAAEAADAGCARDDLDGRWLAICRAVRDWAIEHPHEYALIYGSPVPGYRAPQDTIGPATRLTMVLGRILQDGAATLAPTDSSPPAPAAVLADATRLRDAAFPGAPVDLMVRGLIARTHLFGAISLELFGHHNNVIEDHRALFEHAMACTARFIGIPPQAPSRAREPSGSA
jgi:AcrR family transcriptional regulator